jgi:predicted ribosomally synthesized peptide with SipW-like signal peptide
MKKILLSLLTIAAVSSSTVGATRAYFSDTETSNENTFAAGNIDLTVDDKNGENVAKFHITNMRPGNQPTAKYQLKNIGTINGYLDLKNISVTNEENTLIEPETEAGDLSDDAGELQDVVNMRLYWDNDCNGSYSTGDEQIFTGMTGSVAASYNTNKPLNSGNTQCMMAVFDWWNTANDNKAMTDEMTVNVGFDLSQNQ